MLDVNVKHLLADEEDLSLVVGPLREWLLAPNIVSGPRGILEIMMSALCARLLEIHEAFQHDRLHGSRKNLVISETEGIHGINVTELILEAMVDNLLWILDAYLKAHQWLKNTYHIGVSSHSQMLALVETARSMVHPVHR